MATLDWETDSHSAWVAAASVTTWLTMCSWSFRKVTAFSGEMCLVNSSDSSISGGIGTGFAKKNSRPMAFSMWPMGSTESVIWQVKLFLCSPAHVYLLGLKDPSSRSLL